MLKNITLSADDNLIKAARKKAKHQHTTLNAIFRRWLAHYARQEHIITDYRALMQKLSYAHTRETFSRDELNER